MVCLLALAIPMACASIKNNGNTGSGGASGTGGGAGAGSGGATGTGGMSTGPVIDGLQSITVAPPTQTVTLAPGGSAMATYTATGKFNDGSSRDISTKVSWSSSAPSLIDVAGGVATVRGAGTFDIVARANNLTGMAALVATVTGSLTGTGFLPADQTMLDGPAQTGPADIKYPSDGALFPSNWGTLTVHVAKTNQTSARIAISGDGVDIKYYGVCETGPNSATGCYVSLPSMLTSTLAAASATNDLSLTARLLGPGGVIEGAPIKVAWTMVALTGGLYYWTTLPDTTTSIARYNFAGDSAMPQIVYTEADETMPANGGLKCFGCHAITHDGTKLALTMGGSYPSSFQIIDLANKTTPFVFEAPPIDTGYATETTFNTDGSRMINMYRGKFLLRTVANPPVDLGEMLTSITESKTDGFWSPKGKLFVFAAFNETSLKLSPTDVNRHNADIKTGAQLWIADSDGKTVTDSPRLLVPRQAGFTSYYPAISDDDALVVFNRSDCTGPTKTGAGYGEDPCDGYDDISGTLNLVGVGGGTPTPLTRANGPANSDNSWPRWSPDHGTFRGKTLYWLAFSSRRPYGLQLNQMTADVQGSINNSRPQLWFVALFAPAPGSQGDPSFSAIWLPGQNPNPTPNGNHVPIWVERAVLIQ
ncbi:MAG TPA: hypothetical protein VNO55_23130 [Polyangia bacterium]|nr:hypothetical protein [Polyangia bacterium]